MQVNTKPKRLSPLHDQHQTLGAHFNLRGGWLVPDVYTTAEDEAKVLQESIGLADISASGKLTLKGIHAGAIISASLGKVPYQSGSCHRDQNPNKSW